MIIEDNFLNEEELAEFQLLSKLDSFRIKVDSYDNVDPISKKIIDFAREHFDFTNFHICEMWTNYNNVTLVEHTDHDMNHFVHTGQERYPICSIVFYPLVENIKGGQLKIQKHSIEPKTNRILCFGPGIKHSILPFEGTRVSIVYNLWEHDIL
jgi:hypothetical protein